MTDPKDSKPTALSPSGTTSNLTRKNTVSLPGLHARLRNPVVKPELDPNTRPNRLALTLDVSGSMACDKIVSLRNAVSGFINACNFSDTALAIEPFGEESAGAGRVALTIQQMILLTTVQGFKAYGGTPMAEALDFVLGTYSITRAVLVSDGQPDREDAVYRSAADFKEAGIMIDCVHIGDSTHGEACLRRVAEMTGGQFIKFTDIASFSKSFKYLSPRFYGELTSGNVTASQLGAKELK